MVLSAGPEQARIGHGGGERGRCDDPDAGDGRQALAGRILAMPDHELALEAVYLDGESAKLTGQHQQGRAGRVWQG